MVKEELTEKVTLEQKPEGNEGRTHVNIWGKRLQAEESASAKTLRQGSVMNVKDQQENPSSLSDPGGLESCVVFPVFLFIALTSGLGT